MSKGILVLVLSMLVGRELSALSFEELRQMGGEKPVALTGTLDGIVVSDYRSDNMEYNPNIDHNIVDVGETLRTAYVESFDGRFGVRIKFSSIYDNRLERGDMVRITLDGCHLMKEENPVRYTIEGVVAANVLVARKGVPVPVKCKHIKDLSDEDVYTYVTLEGVEFHQKTGGYVNIFEKSAQTTVLNKLLFCENPPYPSSQNASDTWARLMKDDEGSQIYMLVNSICTWRRNDGGVPQGKGSLSGVIVHTFLPRYGTSLGKYSIRPSDRSDIDIKDEYESSFMPLVQWCWDYNKYARMVFLANGEKRFVKPGTVRNDKLVAESGDGVLWTDSGAWMSLDDEFDASHSYDGWKSARMTGSRSNAALRLDSKSSDWFEFDDRGRVQGYKALYVKTSTKNVSGGKVFFDFSFIASREHSKYSEGFPVEWKVSYSLNGDSFVELPQIYTLRPQCYTNVQHGDRVNVPVHSEAAMGFAEYSVLLPEEVCGKDEIVIRLSPASDVIASFPQRWNESSTKGRASADNTKEIIIRFGTIAVKYLK